MPCATGGFLTVDPGDPMQNVFPLILIAVVYFAFVVPQRRKAKARLAELSQLSSGDRVLLTSGLHGVVIGEDGPSLIVQVAPGTPLHVTRSAVARRTSADEPGVPSLDALGVEEVDALDVEAIETIDLSTDAADNAADGRSETGEARALLAGSSSAPTTPSAPEDGVPA
jgi:preprotein translocase subunit YajC